MRKTDDKSNDVLKILGNEDAVVKILLIDSTPIREQNFSTVKNMP